jgi:hypothetical protein
MTYHRERFFRRRQFVLGPAFLEYPGWKKIGIAEGFLLTVHPDLQVTIVEGQRKKAVLLGYAIDPFHIDLSEEDILRSFINGPVSIDTLTPKLNALTGRFVLVLVCPECAWLFHDACALRQVHYCQDERQNVWCASQAETLAEYFGYEYDREVLSYKSMVAERLDLDELWLLNGRTPYREIMCLLPNHFIDLRTGQIHRFWPVAGCIDSLSVQESIRLLTPILRNSIEAAAKRFDLKMGISAGSDSRRSLAAAKNIIDKIFFYTHTPPASHKADGIIPARLLAKLGIEHHQFDIVPMSPDFRYFYESSATWAREKRGHIAHSELDFLGPDAMVLNSNLSEIPQCYYWLPKNKINGEGLAALTRLYHPFAIDEFQKWINAARPAADESHLNILVLFDIELRSRWVAAAFAEYDIAHDTFCPYNNRCLLSLELAIPERFRRSRRKDVLVQHIRYMWPEVLIEPINPPFGLWETIQENVWTQIIHRTITPFFPIYDYLRYHKLQRRFKQWKRTVS